MFDCWKIFLIFAKNKNMSGGRYTKKIPEKIYFSGEDGNWIQGPYVNKPKGEDPHLRVFKLIEESKKETPKRETWKEFCSRIGIDNMVEENMAALIYFQCVYINEQHLNWRRQIVRIKKLLEATEKKGLKLATENIGNQVDMK